MNDNQTSGTQSDQTNQTGVAAQARQRAIDAFGSARDGIAGARRRTAEGLDEAPLIAIAGGLAAGALIAALLPRTDAEAKALRPVGKRLTDTAKAAAASAKDTGTQRLAELGLTPERGKETLRSILDGVTDAAKSSAQAALSTAREER